MSKPIRVLCGIGSMGGGGSERQMVEILRQLDRSRFTPMLYLTYREGELLDDVPDDVPIFAFWDRHQHPRWNFPGRIHRMQVRDFTNVLVQHNVDVVYDRLYFTTMIAGPATRRCGVPRVSLIDNDPKPDLENTAGRFVAIKRRLLQSAYRNADRVVATSEGARTAAIDYYRLPPEKVVTMYNFVDLEQVGRVSVETIADWDTERFHVVSCGRLHEQKGHRYLIEAVDELVNRRGHVKLLVHILGTGDLENELKAFVEAKQLRQNIVFHGFVKNPFKYYRNSQLFCLSSLYEGFGIVLAEAMACRVPVLATDCPSGPREILADGKYGRLIPPADSSAMADAIEDAITNYETWQSMVEPARQFVRCTFTPSVTLPKLQDLLEQVCQSH